jgi:hypothetical protein
MSPCKEQAKRQQRNKFFVVKSPYCAQSDHAAHHVARLVPCQLSKIQLLVLLKAMLTDKLGGECLLDPRRR